MLRFWTFRPCASSLFQKNFRFTFQQPRFDWDCKGKNLFQTTKSFFKNFFVNQWFSITSLKNSVPFDWECKVEVSFSNCQIYFLNFSVIFYFKWTAFFEELFPCFDWECKGKSLFRFTKFIFRFFSAIRWLSTLMKNFRFFKAGRQR